MAGGRRGLNRQNQNVSKSRPVLPRNLLNSFSPMNDSSTSYVTPKDNDFSSVTCQPAIPDLRAMSNLMFETIFLLYLHVALFCQYIYLFKTVWWYPVSLPPSNTSLNFHLIDGYLTLFLTIFLSRRLLWSFLWDFLRPKSDNSLGLLAWILVCFFAGIIWLSLLIAPLIYLYHSASFLNMLVLCYPILLWVPLSGMSDSCLNLVLTWVSLADANKQSDISDPSTNNTQITSSSQRSTIHTMTRLLENPDNAGDLKMTYSSLGNAVDAPQVRDEVKLLCRDFNSRISEIIFCSMVCAYYVGLVPMFFMKPHQYYDMSWCLQHTLLILFNSFTLLSSQLIHPKYVHVLHKCANSLGGYRLQCDKGISSDEHSTTQTVSTEKLLGKANTADPDKKVYDWSSNSIFSPGIKVKYKNKIYSTVGKQITAEPDDPTHARFFNMFSNPFYIINGLLVVHFLVVVYQIYLLLSSSKWDHLISVALLQFFSYYVLFRILRDRLVLSKSYPLGVRDQLT